MADKDRISLNPQYRGMTSQQIADQQAGDSSRTNPLNTHPSADYSKPKQFVNPNIQPSAPGGKSYGAPIQSPILK